MCWFVVGWQAASPYCTTVLVVGAPHGGLSIVLRGGPVLQVYTKQILLGLEYLHR